VFRQQRTEERGPIRRYKKVRPDSKKRAGSSQPVVRNDDALRISTTSTVSNANAVSTADAGMGSGSSSPPPPPSTPTGAPVFPPSSSLRTARITVVPRNSSARTWILVGVFTIFIAGIAIPLISVGNTITSLNNGIQRDLGATPAVTHQTAGAGAKSGGSKTAPAPKHFNYLTAAGARAGLAVIAKKAPGAHLSLVRLDATSISATARLSNGKSELISIQPTGLFTSTIPASGERSLPIKQIKPSVVARLVAAMKTHFHVPASRIDYMVLNSPTGLPIHWILFTKAPSHPGFSASLNGNHLVRLP
jgi:hypothetical protein